MSSSKYIVQNFSNYELIRKNAIDSINSWVKDSLSVSGPYFLGNPWMLDSIFLFNKDSNRLFTATIKRDTLHKDAVMDYIHHFAGAKINGKWYFFRMAFSLAIPRKLYKYDKYEPLTFNQLSYLAYKEIFARGIKQLPDGRYVTDEAFMERKFFDSSLVVSYGGIDSMEAEIVSDCSVNREYKLDPEEIASIKKSIAESKRPYLEPESWWGKIFKRKIFDE